jgi:hypothetical protein
MILLGYPQVLVDFTTQPYLNNVVPVDFTCWLEAELAAIEEGIDLSLHWSSGDITLESDCLMAIKLTGEQMVNASRHAIE